MVRLLGLSPDRACSQANAGDVGLASSGSGVSAIEFAIAVSDLVRRHSGIQLSVPDGPCALQAVVLVLTLGAVTKTRLSGSDSVRWLTHRVPPVPNSTCLPVLSPVPGISRPISWRYWLRRGRRSVAVVAASRWALRVGHAATTPPSDDSLSGAVGLTKTASLHERVRYSTVRVAPSLSAPSAK